MQEPGRQSVVDVALQGGAVAHPATVSRARVLTNLRLTDAAFHHLTRGAAIAVLIILGGTIISLIHGSIPALSTFGLNFLVEERWNPVTERFGALAPIYGTLVTSTIAMLIAVPLGLLIALFLTELCPMWLRRPIGIAIELLAGIPSIIYGIWGLFVLSPFLQRTLQPALIDTFGDIPVLSTLFAGPPYGIGMLTAGLILAIMVLPFVTSVTRDVFEAVPPVLKEAAYGLGCTTWEVVRYVVLPYARVGVIGAVMLGLGRALGETMAVTFVIGNAHRISASVLAPGTTISATIANEFTEAVGDLYTSALIALGLILFVITPGADGGLLNPIVGSLILTGLAVIIGTPVGILAGTYMAEYGRFSKLTQVVRFINDILLSAPSIVIGLFVYEVMVAPLGHFSGTAGAVALAVLVVPVVVRTTEDMLSLVPKELREAATALGMPRAYVIGKVSYRAARAGIITGVLLAIARISGETAPLLFTALNNQFFSVNLNAPMASLPAVIFQFALSPYEDWQRLAWTGALIITMAVLALSIIARALTASGKSS